MNKCFADKNGMCIILKEKNCEGCNFFKTQNEVDKGSKKTNKRLKEIGSDLYYGKYRR